MARRILVEKEEDELSRVLGDLKEDSALAIVRERIARGIDPLKILESAQSGMHVVGKRYEKGIYFISGLIIAGEIMQEIGKLILPLLASNIDWQDSGTILLGTVEGDIHYIGKDIFKVLARCYGFDVHDIGVNMPPEEFLTTAHRIKPRIIGLSCLLSSCYDSIRRTVSVLREGLSSHTPQIIVGGLVDEKVREYSGANHCVNDAMIGVRICKKIISNA
jgi:methanogenic corrinoid protein MtbC1